MTTNTEDSTYDHDAYLRANRLRDLYARVAFGPLAPRVVNVAVEDLATLSSSAAYLVGTVDCTDAVNYSAHTG